MPMNQAGAAGGERGERMWGAAIRAVDRAVAWTRSWPLLYRFTLFTRILLAAAFIPTGLVKALGRRFTLMSAETPIGGFFEAMYQTGEYWRFLGAGQMIAGVLLLWPRGAHLGAAIFLGIVMNIFVVVVALEFRGTPIVVGLMLLATVYLCLWDWRRFRPMFTEQPLGVRMAEHRLDPWERVGFSAFAAAFIGVFLVTRDFVERGAAPALMAIGAAAGLFALGRFVFLWMRGRLAGLVAA